VKTFLNSDVANTRTAESDVERHENRAENPGQAQQRTFAPEKIKERDPPPERIETAQLRQLPDFVIVGTQRGGTTSLYRYLTAHPEIGSALRKEVHYFDRYYGKGIGWYLAHFPVRGEAPVVGEASPSYLFHPDVPQRARAAVPNSKFIALLRNPADRAYSQYQMNVRKGFESLTFEDAIKKEPERLSRSEDPDSLILQHCSYLKRGLYVDQLERWMSFFAHEQFLILKSEDLYKYPERVLSQSLAYLGLRSWSLARYKAHHLVGYPDMDPSTRKRLTEYFAPYNQRLYNLLGRDLGWEDE
jgi:hypothetical protein